MDYLKLETILEIKPGFLGFYVVVKYDELFFIAEISFQYKDDGHNNR